MKDGGVAEIVHMKGNHDVISKTETMIDDLIDHVLDDEYLHRSGGVIVSIPASVKGADGNDYYLGIFPDDLDFVSKDDKRIRTLPISNLFNRVGGLPPEFILGVIQLTEDEGISIVANEQYISNLPVEKQAELLESYFSKGMPKINARYVNNVLTVEDQTLSTEQIGKRSVPKSSKEDMEYIDTLMRRLFALDLEGEKDDR